jgi:type VI secretion system protein ImpK
MAEPRKSLSDACAPLFLFLSTFWRNAAASKTTVAELKQALHERFDAVRDECGKDPRLAALFERARYGLIAAADQVVVSSSWSHRAAWSAAPLEKDFFKKLEGGKRFYRLVEDVLQDVSDDAVEIAACLFTCMALGFRGELIGEKKELERCRRQLFEKARLAGAIGEHLTPQAYGRNAEGRSVVLPTANTLRLVAISIGALVFLVLSLWVAEGWKNRYTVERLDDATMAIEKAPL